MINPKSEVFAQFAEIARVLGEANRLELLEHAAQGERPVERLAELSGLSVANASRHLQVLRRAGLLRARREGKQVLYRLGDGPVLELLQALRRYAEFASGEMRRVVDDYFARLDALEPVSRAEIARRVKEGGVLLLDVRPEDEFALGHLPGALNVPLAQLSRRLSKLPKTLQIVAYCRGPYCVLSFEAVAALRAKGYDARRLEDGYPEWKMAGLPVEAAAGGSG
ncbi:MAG: metalloregulator ArsR/SmtB family transcription factor [Alphaproteobacteria bacterium]|nr:metalloregulator ArsR/SmtB family transcription factor [Alphaproteobacteria bacterium]MCW5743723.1 metalloregulator ArsR/SmtB family transcription factor [Alphaproteobacteria bacterium]